MVELSMNTNFNHLPIYLGVGSISKNCVDAAIEICNETDVPIQLVASRRQIETETQGRGYVCNWSTAHFANYVRKKNINRKIILVRDHGGPYQNAHEFSLNEVEALKSAKLSFEADIEADFDMIHIDPSNNLSGDKSKILHKFIEITKELYYHCYTFSVEKKKNIAFEIGTDEGVFRKISPQEFIEFLDHMIGFCHSESLPLPSYVVVPIGTLVMEDKNIGDHHSLFSSDKKNLRYHTVKQMVLFCKERGVLTKIHNSDYLSHFLLSKYPKLGIGAANIAPQFGVLETKTFLKILKRFNLHHLEKKFIDLAYESGKWKKWLLPNSTTTSYERAVISGHYVFSAPEFLVILQEIEESGCISKEELNYELKNTLKKKIYRILTSFCLI